VPAGLHSQLKNPNLRLTQSWVCVILASVAQIHRAGNRMTIDQRLDRLTERHEALTQTVELMVAENRERDRRWAERGKVWDKQMDQVMEGLARLLHTAEIRRRRIERLEG